MERNANEVRAAVTVNWAIWRFPPGRPLNSSVTDANPARHRAGVTHHSRSDSHDAADQQRDPLLAAFTGSVIP